MATLRPDALIHFFPGGPGTMIVNRRDDLVVSRLQAGGNPLCYAVDTSATPRIVRKGPGQAEGVVDAMNEFMLPFHRTIGSVDGLPANDAEALAMLQGMMLDDGARQYFDSPTLGMVGRTDMCKQAQATLAMLLTPFSQYMRDDDTRMLVRCVEKAFVDPEVMAAFATPENAARHNAADRLLTRVMQIMAESSVDSSLVNFVDHIRLQHFAENEFDQLMTRMRKAAASPDVSGPGHHKAKP